MHGAHSLGSARRVLRYWPIEATAAAGVLDKRELEGRVRHRCTASAVHDAHGLGSARRVLRYWPIEATAAANPRTSREPRDQGPHRSNRRAALMRRALPAHGPSILGRGQRYSGSPSGVPSPTEQRGQCACAAGPLEGALLLCSTQSQGEDRGSQGRQVASPAQLERRGQCACALDLLEGALLLCGARVQGEDNYRRQVAFPTHPPRRDILQGAADRCSAARDSNQNEEISEIRSRR